MSESRHSGLLILPSSVLQYSSLLNIGLEHSRSNLGIKQPRLHNSTCAILHSVSTRIFLDLKKAFCREVHEGFVNTRPDPFGTDTKLVWLSLAFIRYQADPLQIVFFYPIPNESICGSVPVWDCTVPGYYRACVKPTQFRPTCARVDPIQMERNLTDLVQTWPKFT